MTLREHLEAVRAERYRTYEGDTFLAFVEALVRITEHMDAAIAILDVHEHEKRGHYWYCLVPDDPETDA